MTTSALSAVLPSVPKTQASSANASSSGEGGFSAVLSDQSARQQATRTSGQQGQSSGQSGQPAGQAAQQAASASNQGQTHAQPAQGSNDANAAAETTQPGAETATAANDANLASQAAGQGLTLAQLTLNIAAEVAAVRGNGANGTVQAATSPQAALAAQSGTALQGEAALQEALAATRNGAGTQNAEINIDPARALAAEQALANRGNTASTSPLAAGLLQAAQTSAGLQPAALAAQTAVNSQQRTTQAAPAVTGQAARLAGMKQAVLTAQQRLDATQNGQAQLPASDLFSALANAQGEPSDPITNLGLQQDWLARQGATQSAGLQTAMAATPGMGTTSLAGAATAQPAVGVPLTSPQWGAEFGRQFVSIVQGGATTPHTAELRLDPPDLGPLRISISLSDNTAQASFVSPHAAVRQTVENALPQLQQLLAQAGISLGQTSVSDQGQPEQAFNQGASGNGGGNGNGSGTNAGSDNGGLASVANAAARVISPNALVDTFA